MIEITSNSDLEAFKKNKHGVLYFSAEWCLPCKLLKPRMESLSIYEPNLVVAHVDVDNCPDLAKEYDIRSIPTLIFLKDGVIKERHIGGLSEAGLNVRVKVFLET